MDKIIKDKFVTRLVGYKSYLLNGCKNPLLLKKKIINLKRPFFLTIKSNKKITKSLQKVINVNYSSKLLTLEKKYKLEKELPFHVCRLVKKKDISQLKKISLENTSNSRFVKDKKIPKKFKYYFRYLWLKNFFKKERGNFLIVCCEKELILGFLLLLKKKTYYQVDLILVKKDKQKKGVGHSLINYVNNFFMRKKKQKLVVGTQSDNISALRLYKKNGFKKVKDTYVYHIHS